MYFIKHNTILNCILIIILKVKWNHNNKTERLNMQEILQLTNNVKRQTYYSGLYSIYVLRENQIEHTLTVCNKYINIIATIFVG